MKLTRENIYINLQGKSKEELTELYNFLKSVGEKQYRTSLRGFLENYKNYETYNFNMTWTLGWYINSKNKQEVTIQQLKEILQPMDLTIEQQLEKAEAEVKRLKEAIEESKIKIGNWVCNKGAEGILKVDEIYINHIDKGYHKITNTQLIELLEQEIK